MKGQERLRGVLDGVRDELEAGLAEAESELARLDARRAELVALIEQARAALGIDVSQSAPREAPARALTLHDALAQVLRERANAWASARELADEVNRRRLYVKRDGSDVAVSQVHARIKNYSQLFEKEGASIRLRED